MAQLSICIGFTMRQNSVRGNRHLAVQTRGIQIEQLLDKGKRFYIAQGILKGETDKARISAFNNLEQAEIIPILGLVYSVKRSAFSEEDEAIVLETPYPFAIDFFHGKIKPDINVFFEAVFL
ncbi:hypothetical protein DAPPUDRAFT_122668 [Daphnia pulex]|uniref:Uncharacterized protein n=1 Tax=Daphnia pulex TaxID=6669 RepID=E9I4V7_DAPPU|nr:hypothetical protein DAPPUDRAFT_122668 [Daphnia pulex]|eukprot:EFX60973.1 hypothetical protein DAPPUDRAFT_122668 [Daphnia pulex]